MGKQVHNKIFNLPFFFSRNPGFFLPLCALSNCHVEIELKFKTLTECIVHKYNYNNNTATGIDGTAAGPNPTPAAVAQYAAFNESVTGSISSIDIIAQYIHLDKED